MTEDELEVAVAELRPSLEALLMIAAQPLDAATLAAVAYKQPVSRARVSAIRGVNGDGVMRTLLTRGLVEEAGEDHSTGAHLYRTSSYFLERIGVPSLEELPELAPYLPDLEDLDDLEEELGGSSAVSADPA